MSTGVWPHSFREFKLVKTDSELKWGNLAAYEFELGALVALRRKKVFAIFFGGF